MDGTWKPKKRVILLRRLELNADAATHLEEPFPRGEERCDVPGYEILMKSAG